MSLARSTAGVVTLAHTSEYKDLLSTIRYTSFVDSGSSGELLRDARKRVKLSQIDLARRAGVSQSVISAYESGRRQPSLPTLARLIEASGYELDISLRRRESRLDRLRGPLGRRVRGHRVELIEAAARHGAVNLRVFGSVARSEETDESDVDVLVDLAPGVGLFGLARLQNDLERILRAPVEIVPADDLKAEVAANVRGDLVAL